MANVGAAAAGKTLIGTGLTGSPTFASIGTSSGLTANGVVIAEGNNAFQATSAGTLGQVLMSNGFGVNPSFQSGGSVFATSFVTDSGTATPSASILNDLGSGSITTSASGNTITTSLTGLTSHSVLVGAGTSTITKLAVGTNGQVLIGATGADPAFATITSTGGTIAFTLGANSLNMEVASSGFTWNNVTSTSATMVKENGYQANNAGLVTLTMPSVASSTFGDTIKIAGFGAGGFLIQCVATQIIHFGSAASTAAGSVASTNRYDQLELVCSSTTNEWFVRNSVGNFTVS